MIPGSANPLLLGQTDSGYEIERSLRFNSGDSSRLTRTFSAGNRKVFTISLWAKKSQIGSTYEDLFGCDVGGQFRFIWEPNGNLEVYSQNGSTTTFHIDTVALFRDPSAWYHFVVSVDATNTSVKFYVNGVELTDFVVHTAVQNLDTMVNSAALHTIGSKGVGQYLNAYLADVHFIDGQALAATDFGETDQFGVWRPKKYEGQYNYPQSGGSSSAPTSTTDVAPSGSYGNGIASAALLFGSSELTNGQNHIRQDNGGIEWSPAIALTGSDVAGAKCLYFNSADSSYAIEFKINGSWVTAQSNAGSVIGTNQGQGGLITLATTGNWTGVRVTGGGNVHVTTVAGIFVNGTRLQAVYSFPAVNGFHLDFADNSSNAALGTDTSGNGNTWTVNNLTAAAAGLATANQGFDVVSWSGNSSARSITSLAFQPDLVWIKSRTAAWQHVLQDSVRGTNVMVASNDSAREADFASPPHWGYVSAFNSNGFSLATGGGGYDQVNKTGQDYIAWCWKAGGAASSNTDGTITSSVSANNTYGFSIVSFTDGGSACTVGHGLSSAPKMIWAKFRGAAGNWSVYHEAIGNDHRLKLNLVDVKQSGNDWWNATSPTSSVFSLGSNLVANTTQIAYCWSEIPGFSKISSYAGSNSSQTIECGFEPAFVIIKCTTSGNDWIVQDNARGIEVLRPNLADAELGGNYVSFTSTGFTLNTSDGRSNSSGDTYIYVAFATKPDESVIDSLVDTPTNEETPTDTGAGGEVVGNYATLNPLDRKSTVSLSNGNLDATTSSTGWAGVKGTMGVSSGKYYFEATANGSAANKVFFGICASSVKPDTSGYLQDDTTERAKGMLIFCDNGLYQLDGNSRVSYSSSMADGDVISVAYDLDGNTVQFYKNGNALGSIDISSSPLASTTVVPLYIHYNTNTTYHLNFGQRAFAYAAPSGYKSLNTANLPEPTIADGSLYFDTKLYTGNGSTQSITGYNFSPDFVWLKSRNQAYNHYFYDQIRGVAQTLQCNSTSAESNQSTTLTSFNSDGFSLGDRTGVNSNNNTFVGWAWDAGTSTVTNNDGSIASQVRANPSAGFSICSYTGTAANATFGHGLNAAPEMVIIKQRDGTGFWVVGHKDAGFSSDNYLRLNGTNANSSGGGVAWQSTAPTSSVVSIGSSNQLNVNNSTNIAYCFAPVEGYSAMGSYVGTGSSPNFVYLGFRPKLIIIKNINGGNNWLIQDSERSTYNLVDDTLHPNTNDDEDTNASNYGVDFLSNGFALRTTGGYTTNSNNASEGHTYIYYAVAENPFQANGGLAR